MLTMFSKLFLYPVSDYLVPLGFRIPDVHCVVRKVYIIPRQGVDFPGTQTTKQRDQRFIMHILGAGCGLVFTAWSTG